MTKATGNRKKLDKDGDGKITGKDFAMLRSGKKGKTMKKTKNTMKKKLENTVKKVELNDCRIPTTFKN